MSSRSFWAVCTSKRGMALFETVHLKHTLPKISYVLSQVVKSYQLLVLKMFTLLVQYLDVNQAKLKNKRRI